MADQKLNEIPQVQSSELANVKAFFALMTNGEIKQMSKEDMASVVGGLAKPTIFNNGYLFSVDADEILDSGSYYLGEDILNANSYSYLIVFKLSNNTILQINTSNAQELTNGISGVKIRGKHEGKNWSIWRNFTITPL